MNSVHSTRKKVTKIGDRHNPLLSQGLQKEMFAAYPAGVCVITTDSQLGPVGVTVSSVSSLSLDPQLLSWALKKDSQRSEAYRDCEEICVHMLSHEQSVLALDFARSGLEPFCKHPFKLTDKQTPLLEDCSSRLMCRPWATYDGGDHWLFVSQITEISDFGLDPMVYVNRQFLKTSRLFDDDTGGHAVGGSR